MSNDYEEMASLEELDFLMEELDSNRAKAAFTATAATSANTSLAFSVPAPLISTTAAALLISSPSSAAVASVSVAAGSSVTTAAANTFTIDISQTPSIPDNHLELVAAQQLSKIPVLIMGRQVSKLDYFMEKPVPFDDDYFDDASLAKCSVPLSFDESGISIAASSRPAGIDNALNFIPTKSATPEMNPQHQRANTFIPTISSRNTLASSQTSPVTTRAFGGLREVITISFQTIEARDSGLGRLEEGKCARSDGMTILIKVLENEKQVKVSGPALSGMRGFVMTFCPERDIRAQLK